MKRPTTVARDFELELSVGGQTYLCDVRGTAKCLYIPGRTSGPPESCYEDESEIEAEFTILSCDDGEQQLPLTPELVEKLQAALPISWMESALWDQYMRGDN